MPGFLFRGPICCEKMAERVGYSPSRESPGFSLCVHLQLPSGTPSHDRPEAERVYELQAGLYKFQFRKVLFVSFRIECHETIRLRQGMRSNDEISKQTPRPLLRCSSSPLCVPCKPPAGLKPYALLKLEVDVDARIRQKAVHKGFRGLGMGQQLRVDWRAYN
jgi:hypothetical protein